jgi:chromosome segregation ATPase
LGGLLLQVDAALDLSHTQNIGTMLRTHFSQSQFIVVSLKEVRGQQSMTTVVAHTEAPSYLTRV